MMSDMLFEAVLDIERYQQEFPHYYDDLRSEIETVKTAMSGLVRLLDQPPATAVGTQPETAAPEVTAALVGQNSATEVDPGVPGGFEPEDHR